MTEQTLLGLFDGYMPLRRDALTSETKLGGSAVYFPPLSDEQQREISSWTTCGACGHRMFLLLQAYSPLPSMPAASNRMLYVFCCNSSSCARQPSSSWCAFSVAVGKEDTAALDAPESDGSGDAAKGGEESPEEPAAKKDLPPNTFPPCFVYVEEEPDNEIIVPTDLEREMMKMAEANARVDSNGIRSEDLEELEKCVDLKGKKSDYYYEKFRSRLARAPDQVLRYHERPKPKCTTTNAMATTGAAGAISGEKKEERPLFMNPEKIKRFVSIPACATCGAALVHELQIMPTTLYYLQVSKYVNRKEVSTLLTAAGPSGSRAGNASGEEGHSTASVAAAATASSVSSTSSGAPGEVHLKPSGDEGVDFGTVTIYVCSRDCGAATLADGNVHLQKEFVCVEEPPSLRDERREAEEEGGKRDLRQILEDEASLEDDEGA